LKRLTDASALLLSVKLSRRGCVTLHGRMNDEMLVYYSSRRADETRLLFCCETCVNFSPNDY